MPIRCRGAASSGQQYAGPVLQDAAPCRYNVAPANTTVLPRRRRGCHHQGCCRLRVDGKEPGPVDYPAGNRQRQSFGNADARRRRQPRRGGTDRVRDDWAPNRHLSTDVHAQSQPWAVADAIALTDSHADPAARTLRVHRLAGQQHGWLGQFDGNDPRGSGPDCAWTAAADASWLTVTSGASGRRRRVGRYAWQ
jgi:hypothetical protein